MSSSSIRQNISETELLTVQEVSRMLKISTGTLYNKVSRGEIEYLKIFGMVRFEKKYIERLLNGAKIKDKAAIVSSISNIND